MVLGVYYLTTADKLNQHKGDGRAFSDMFEVELAYQLDQLEIQSNILLRPRPGTMMKAAACRMKKNA